MAQSLSLWAKVVSPLGRIALIIRGLKRNDVEIVVEKRPVVKLKLQTGKKFLAASGSRDGKIGN